MKKEDITTLDENGKPHGLHIWYYKNENIMYKKEYFHGKLNGIYELYTVNRNLCDNNDCKLCFDKSFASHEKSK